MKAIVLAAGKGTRLQPFTYTIPKHLLPVANKQVLRYVIENLIEAGIREIGLVVSPDTCDKIKKDISECQYSDANFTFMIQREPLGLAHAVNTARDFIGDSDFVLYLGDNLLQNKLGSLLIEFYGNSLEALIALKAVEDPRAFGVAELDEAKHIVRVVEKPKEPKSNLALVGVYIFTPKIFEMITHLKPSQRGEYEITDAIQMLIDHNLKVKGHELEGWWLDVGKREDLLKANQTLLGEQQNSLIEGEVDDFSRISGIVEIKRGAQIINCVISGPVSIAAGCCISNSKIEPFTSIGTETHIENSRISKSIVMSNTFILSANYLEGSVIGRHVKITRQDQNPISISLFLGDDSHIKI